MSLARRDLLARTGAALAAGTIATSPGWHQAVAQTAPQPLDGVSLSTWDGVRAQFALSDEYIHLSAMLIASHPKPVRDAIEAHRRAMDASPLTYLFQNNRPLQDSARAAAGQYLGVSSSDIALTDSTTMGVSLVYNGLRLTPDQEILTTEQDYYVTHEATRLASLRTGAKVRKVSLYEQIQGITAEQIVDRIAQAVTPATRVVALTWVHSSTGLKLPLRRIADALEAIQCGAGRASPRAPLRGRGSRLRDRGRGLVRPRLRPSSWRAATSGCSDHGGRASSPE